MNRHIAAIAAVFGMLLCAGSGWASAPLNVSVTLDGPDEGFADEPLEYLATGSFDLDGATQTEVANGEATVEEEYEWSYAPGSCDTEPADGPEETFRFALEHSPGQYTITVTYTVTVRYKDETWDQDFAVDDIKVTVKVVDIAIDVTAEEGRICAGGRASAPYQMTVTATVTDALGQPVPGKTVEFSANHIHSETGPGPTCSPDKPVTNAQGIATTTLTSGDAAVAGQVRAECEGSADEGTVSFQLPETEFTVVDPITEEPIEYLLADGESQCKVVVHFTYGGVDLPGHSIGWYFRFWTWEQKRDKEEPIYSGEGQEPYGSIVPPTPSETDDDGLGYAIYTIGTTPGWIRFRMRMLDLREGPAQ